MVQLQITVTIVNSANSKARTLDGVTAAKAMSQPFCKSSFTPATLRSVLPNWLSVLYNTFYWWSIIISLQNFYPAFLWHVCLQEMNKKGLPAVGQEKDLQIATPFLLVCSKQSSENGHASRECRYFKILHC